MLILWILLGSALLFVLQRVIYTNYWDRKLNVSMRFSKRAVTEGETAELLERSENRKILPLPAYEYRYTLNRNFKSPADEDKKPVTLYRKLALPAKRAVSNRVKIQGLVRGVYSIGDATVYASDLFRTVKLNWPVQIPSQLIVYPAKVPVQKLSLPARLILGTVNTRRMTQEDPFALKSIRPYEIYDSPRIINWKASAKTGELKVNQFENTTDEALLFLLDMGGGEIEDREQLIRVASSLSLFFLRHGVSVALMANCRNCITGKPLRVRAGADVAHQITVDEALAQINLSIPETEPFEAFLAGVPQDALKGAMPVILTADASGAARQAFLKTPGTRDGYYLFVREDGDILTERGLQLTDRSAGGKEARL